MDCATGGSRFAVMATTKHHTLSKSPHGSDVVFDRRAGPSFRFLVNEHLSAQICSAVLVSARLASKAILEDRKPGLNTRIDEEGG
jgi:hypothetical protein